MGFMMGKTTKYSKILILIFFCLGGTLDASNNDRPKYVEYVKEIRASCIEEVEKSTNLICIGVGSGMPYDVEEISLKFMSHQKPTLEEARKLQVFVTEKLLEKINSHEKIRPFLREYPFKYDRVLVSITYRDKNNAHYDQGITLVFNIREQIRYKEAVPKTELFQLFHKETFEEAKKALQQGL